MYFTRFHFIFFCFLLLFIHTTAQKNFKPKALVLPVIKHRPTQQYIVQLNQRTPLVPVKYTLDLGGPYLWANCEQGYVSSSYKPVFCNTPQCKLANSDRCKRECHQNRKPGCHNNTCALIPVNTVAHTFYYEGDVGQDFVAIKSTDGFNPGRTVSLPNLIFVCAATKTLRGLASSVKGMAGFGRTNISLPSQFSSYFGFPKVFAICLSSSTKSNGVVFFGNGPYSFSPHNDLARPLIYTPLLPNPFSIGGGYFRDVAAEYYVGVTSIQISGKTVPLNKSFLSINKDGNGGTTISTVHPYTVMESTIYKAFTNTFTKLFAAVPRVAPVAPFTVCYNLTKLGTTPQGPPVPRIDLGFQSDTVSWNIYGANSMVQIKKDVHCLGFVDAKQTIADATVEHIPAISIGGHQLENHLLQFDLDNKMLAFSASLLLRATSCSRFNFTSTA